MSTSGKGPGKPREPDAVNPPRKKRFFLAHKKSSALFVTVAIHLGFIGAALTFVMVNAMKPEPAVFEAVDVERPKPPLKKLKIPVKDNRKQAPKIRQMVVTRPNTQVNLKMPEMVGVVGGAGFGKGTGLGENMPGFDFDVFGGNGGAGNEFVGTFYDLKQTAEGKRSEIGEMVASGQGDVYSAFFDEVEGFVSGGWNTRRLKDYFKAPKLKYATAFMIPQMDASAAPKAFSVEDKVQPKFWIAHYKGKIAAPEAGEYRFCGFGDDVMVVRVGKKLVLNGSMAWCAQRVSDWESDDDNSGKFPIGDHAKYKLVMGDWFSLRKGQVVDVEVLFGEVPGVKFGQYLLIEKKGENYRKVATQQGMRPILPVFKTTEIPPQLIEKMNVDPNQATLEGPVFGVLTNAR